MTQSIHFSSNRDDWATPQAWFNALDSEFAFTLDAAASSTNAKCARYYTEADDGLVQNWGSERVWLNPPYGKGIIDRWIDKAIAAAAQGATVVALVPDRPGSHWHRSCMLHADEYRQLDGRVTFEGAEQPAPFPSAVFVFRPGPHRTWTTNQQATFTMRPRRRSNGARPSWLTIHLRPSVRHHP